MTDDCTDRLDSHAWSAVKLDRYGLKFYYTHVLHKPWKNIDLIKPPKTQRLPDIVTIDEAKRLFRSTLTRSYRVCYFTVYRLGRRLGEGWYLEVGDIDAHRQRVPSRDAKGNKDRFVPLPAVTLDRRRRCWPVHRPPVRLFPHRQGGLKWAHRATRPLDRGGVPVTLRQVVADGGIKKDYPAQPTPPLGHPADRSGRCPTRSTKNPRSPLPPDHRPIPSPDLPHGP